MDEIFLGNGSAKIRRVYCFTVLYRREIVQIEQLAFLESYLSISPILSTTSLNDRVSTTSFLYNPNYLTGNIRRT
ncbi:MAG TPA: hypothetical protein O0W88_03705 [Methanocorpusculum sp.]|nr:hypothetical protein [Methanocorpusculum sp.]